MEQREHLKRILWPSFTLLRRSARGISTQWCPITLHGNPSMNSPTEWRTTGSPSDSTGEIAPPTFTFGFSLHGRP
jgi:hypothetical protein